MPSHAASAAEPERTPPERGVASWLPGLFIALHYRRSWLVHDVVAGLVLTTLLIPAGMGYAEASGLPAITGLYATIIPLLVYALVGPSRIMVLGPDSALTAIIAAAVGTLSGGSAERAVALAAMLALLTGTLCLAAGVAKLGFLTELLSKPVRVGYLNGIGLTVLVAQLPKLFGFAVQPVGVLPGVLGFVRGVASGATNPEALVIGGAALLLILLLRAFVPKLPGMLLAVVLATAAVTAFGLGDRLSIVGPVPRGLPMPTFPRVSLSDLGQLLLAAIGIALVSFADTSVLSRTLAGRGGYRVDPNRELIALGLANFGGGLIGGFPVSGSSSRTPVAELAGARTQLASAVGALAMLALLVAAPALLQNLPTTALAAVVIAAALRIFDFTSLQTFYRVRRSDFGLSLLALFTVAVFGVLAGIVLAIGFSLLDVIRRAWRPHEAILGAAPGVKGYHDIARYPEAKQVPGLLLFRWDAPLFFANADLFRVRLLRALEHTAPPVKWVVVAAEPITDVDTTAAEMLQGLDTELSARGTELAFAEMKDPVKDHLTRYGLHKTIGGEFFFPTVGVAVKAFLDRNHVNWVGWEDELLPGPEPPARP